jgi:hypothetical protein
MRVAPAVVVSPERHRVLERYARGRRVPLRLVQRSQALLLAAEGKRNTEIAQAWALGATPWPTGVPGLAPTAWLALSEMPLGRAGSQRSASLWWK